MIKFVKSLLEPGPDPWQAKFPPFVEGIDDQKVELDLYDLKLLVNALRYVANAGEYGFINKRINQAIDRFVDRQGLEDNSKC